MKTFLLIGIVCISFLQQLKGQNILPNGFRQETLKINGNIGNWVSTNIVVNEGDFVIFEVQGEILFGLWAGSAPGCGFEPQSYLNSYNYFPDMCHGAVIAKNGEEFVQATTTNRIKGFIEYEIWFRSFEDDNFIGYYFVSDTTQELKFIINDKHFENNVGSFNLKVTVMPFLLHVNRNKFNKCPKVEPTIYIGGDDTTIDNSGFKWTSSIKEKIYHGLSNTTYRGYSVQVLGAQCVYNTGTLINSGPHIGTYDYAFGLELLDSKMKYHALWDVIPHEIYNERYLEQDKEFFYAPITDIY